MQKIKRQLFVSALAPTIPDEYKDNFRFIMTSSHKELKKFESQLDEPFPQFIWDWRILMTLLWSDSVSDNGLQPNMARGGGVMFGPDITEEFLRQNKLKCIVRSHQCKEKGYSFSHNRKVLTIFSVSNYYGPDSNKGAIIEYESGYKHPHIKVFQVDEATIKKQTQRKLIEELWNKSLAKIDTRLQNNAGYLKKIFKSKSIQDQFIKVEDWQAAINNIMHLDIPWYLLKRHKNLELAYLDNQGMCVQFEKTLR